jgi:hypothetical protein
MTGNQQPGGDVPIQTGDVCLDLAQGRPVHVVEDTGLTAGEWADANNYDLTENYGNGRLGATDDDRVFEVVYCSNAKSEPSKTYAMPESRLLRVETEAADGGRPVRERIVRETLVRLFKNGNRADLQAQAKVAGFSDDLVDEANELADVDETITAED